MDGIASKARQGIHFSLQKLIIEATLFLRPKQEDLRHWQIGIIVKSYVNMLYLVWCIVERFDPYLCYCQKAFPRGLLFKFKGGGYSRVSIETPGKRELTWLRHLQDCLTLRRGQRVDFKLIFLEKDICHDQKIDIPRSLVKLQLKYV